MSSKKRSSLKRMGILILVFFCGYFTAHFYTHPDILWGAKDPDDGTKTYFYVCQFQKKYLHPILSGHSQYTQIIEIKGFPAGELNQHASKGYPSAHICRQGGGSVRICIQNH